MKERLKALLLELEREEFLDTVTEGALDRIAEFVEKEKARATAFLDEALNSGDGTYRP